MQSQNEMLFFIRNFIFLHLFLPKFSSRYFGNAIKLTVKVRLHKYIVFWKKSYVEEHSLGIPCAKVLFIRF